MTATLLGRVYLDGDIARLLGAESLEAALVAAFPAVQIDRAMLDEPTARLSDYDDHAVLEQLEGKSWRELPDSMLYEHSTLLIYAGDRLFHATVPAFLHYLLREHDVYNDLGHQVAGELTREDAPAKLERRMGCFTPAQRAAVRDVLAHLANHRFWKQPMTRALETWKAG